MAAVTANQLIRSSVPGHRVAYPAGAVHFYSGTLGYVDAATGFLTNDDNDGANKFAGVVIEETDNSGGNAGSVDVEVYTVGEFELTGSSFTQASVGALVYGVDNYTLQASSSSATKVGRVTEFVSATKVVVDIRAGTLS